MLNDKLENDEKIKSAISGKESSAGKSLKKIFRQDETLKKIEKQPASVSMLMNPLRLSLFLHLCQNPCDHTRSIARNMGIGLTVVNWHLGQLHDKGYIESAKIKGRRAYWPTGMVLTHDIAMVKTLRNEWATHIIKTISEKQEGIRQKALVIEIGDIQQKINVWLGIMVSAGMLDKHGHRMNSRYRVAEHIPIKIGEYDEKASQFSKIVLNTLRNDGLMPKKARLRGSRLSVDVKLPSENKRLYIECNPLAPLRSLVYK